MAMDSKREAQGRDYADEPGGHAYGSQGNFIPLSDHSEVPSFMGWTIVSCKKKFEEADVALLTAVAGGNPA